MQAASPAYALLTLLGFRVGERCPAQTDRNRPAVIFSLDRVLFASKIETEDFIVQIQHGNDGLQSVAAGNPVTHLRVHLGVGIKIRVAVRTFAGTSAVGPNVAIVMRKSHAR